MELLASINALEITIAKLEEELIALHFHLYHERNERLDVEYHLKVVPIQSPEHSSTSLYMWEDHVSSLRVPKHNEQVPATPQSSFPGSRNLESVQCSVEDSTIDKALGPCNEGEEERQIDLYLQKPIFESKNLINLWQYPNKLSEEMVLCMRNIFLCLSGSSDMSPKTSLSDCLSLPSSPVGHCSSSSLTSLSCSSIIPSSMQSSSQDLNYYFQVINQEKLYDPYGVNESLNWRDIGEYSLATDVSWMSVGKTQLEYAAEALKRFRCLVEQLAKVNPIKMSNDEKLAFWINLYNALIMHAYLAYGVSRSDVKLFSLMQKACYTVGVQSFSAADIEFVLLKMKPPAHRPQMALMLAVHKFKMTQEHRNYSVENPEPMALFALSCGMYSCPAVRIFTKDNIQDVLQRSMRDYIRASVGISDKGKLLVPKLLYCYAKGVVEDSLLVDWICRYLTSGQAAVVRNSTSQRKQRLLGARSFSVIPFDSRFRYLFLP
ncbi:hypothetical protein AXF42_Ash011757 [Apostasia shenzhenica]|uniref:DUF547 domain-containing protein n=1 Tax=Apostasia shenzhenica TaxID=1088818 RepID=A0A2H9ZUY2_9ASPA|nr:hypothetical protein AXF42_Ash011757 [Apostasia shenzhenica]